MNDMIASRLKRHEPSQKMASMAEKSAAGKLNSFSGMFQVHDLSDHEKKFLKAILEEYASSNSKIEADLHILTSLTSEIKALHHQAALLHGERIKRAHTILTSYKEGAFTTWLSVVYGNRQTPYNLMQYYEFFSHLPNELKGKAESLPRQAIYTLASRNGEASLKWKLVAEYKGETKREMLEKIREFFPLPEHDRRKENKGDAVIDHLERALHLLNSKKHLLSHSQKAALKQLLNSLSFHL
jgi:hypothetical protein